jgi:hypothetical protein
VLYTTCEKQYLAPPLNLTKGTPDDLEISHVVVTDPLEKTGWKVEELL